MPHVDLGNSLQDTGQGLNSFAAGLVASRQRQQQIALQEALAKSQSAHLDAETNTQIPAQAAETGARTDYLGSQTQDAAAQAAQRESANLPADDDDEMRLREVDPTAPHGIYRGYTKAMANEHTKTIANYMATKQRISSINERFYDHGQLATDPQGNSLIVRPNQPNGGGAEQIGSRTGPGNQFVPDNVGKPLNVAERTLSGKGLAAKSAHTDLQSIEDEHPEVAQEVAKAVALPNFGRLTFIPGTGEGISQALQSFRLAGASPTAQQYLKRMFDFVGTAGPSRYGLRGMQNERTLQQLWTDFGLGQFGLSHQGILAAQKNRLNAVLQMQESAGPRAWDQGQGVFDAGTPKASNGPVTSKYGYTR